MLEIGTLVDIGRRSGVITSVVGEEGYIVRILGGGSQFVQRRLVRRGMTVAGPLMVPAEGSALRKAFG